MFFCLKCSGFIVRDARMRGQGFRENDLGVRMYSKGSIRVTILTSLEYVIPRPA